MFSLICKTKNYVDKNVNLFNLIPSGFKMRFTWVLHASKFYMPRVLIHMGKIIKQTVPK